MCSMQHAVWPYRVGRLQAIGEVGSGHISYLKGRARARPLQHKEESCIIDGTDPRFQCMLCTGKRRSAESKTPAAAAAAAVGMEREWHSPKHLSISTRGPQGCRFESAKFWSGQKWVTDRPVCKTTVVHYTIAIQLPRSRMMIAHRTYAGQTNAEPKRKKEKTLKNKIAKLPERGTRAARVNSQKQNKTKQKTRGKEESACVRLRSSRTLGKMKMGVSKLSRDPESIPNPNPTNPGSLDMDNASLRENRAALPHAQEVGQSNVPTKFSTGKNPKKKKKKETIAKGSTRWRWREKSWIGGGGPMVEISRIWKRARSVGEFEYGFGHVSA
ncbi:hypothetical protein F5148DRAFT_1366502 [Russula earlei]|uniref:Uncharacterized protein n=1 Tax=Russula earlei TaxID=71964 RepID=A0ACC0UFZ2_9AGAM|nr:hypothetical protein F5148DRAFT_1366502 [Russula earlei]